MYYTSPLYSREIQKGLACELNRLYLTFTQRNPDFTSRGGKVSIIAHSLGCVIVYDIITGWSITHTLEQRKVCVCSFLQIFSQIIANNIIDTSPYIYRPKSPPTVI